MRRPVPALPLCALSALLTGPAWAGCAPSDFGLVICAGTEPGGIEDRTEGLVVEVRRGATVAEPDGFGTAILLGDGARVLNQGTVRGGDAIVAGDRFIIENEGAIGAGARAAVTGGDDSSLMNREGATIDGVFDGVRLGVGGTIDNRGSIASGERDGVVIGGGTILNSGAITSSAKAGVVLGAEGPDGESLLDNSGVVGGSTYGVIGGAGSQTVINAGTIFGDAEVGAIALGDGSDLVVAVLGGEIDGATFLDAGDDALLLHVDPADRARAAYGLFDGGAGFDEVQFNNFTSEALSAEAVEGGFFLSLIDGATSLTATLTNFESFIFEDATLSVGDVATTIGPAPALVPLPAGLPLLAAALGGLAFMRGRRPS